jgi:hypothetical protein
MLVISVQADQSANLALSLVLAAMSSKMSALLEALQQEVLSWTRFEADESTEVDERHRSNHLSNRLLKLVLTH